MAFDPFSPRKVARQSRARGTIDEIIQASGQIVSRPGLGRLPPNHIAERGGGGGGAPYHYFPAYDSVLAPSMSLALGV